MISHSQSSPIGLGRTQTLPASGVITPDGKEDDGPREEGFPEEDSVPEEEEVEGVPSDSISLLPRPPGFPPLTVGLAAIPVQWIDGQHPPFRAFAVPSKGN